MAPKDPIAALKSAVRDRALIWVERSYDPNRLVGYAVGLKSCRLARLHDAASRTAALDFSLVTIHREKSTRKREFCWIGIPQGFTGKLVEMREITPAARFEESASRHSLSAITKIDFGDGYAAALADVARKCGEG
jgi:hypothetical protein